MSGPFGKRRRDHEFIVDAIWSKDRGTLIEVLTGHAIFLRTRLTRAITEACNSDIDFCGLALHD